MVQQLALVSSIDDDSVDLFVSTIIACYGVSPILFSNLTTVWRPNPSLQISNVNAKNQIVEPNRLKLLKDIPLKWLLDKHLTSGNKQLDKNSSSKSLDYKFIKNLTSNELPIDSVLVDNALENNSHKKQSESGNNFIKKEKVEIKQENSIGNPQVIDIDEIDNNDPAIDENVNDQDIKMEDNTESHVNFIDKTNWCLSISDIPAAGNNRKVSMQNINETVIKELSGANVSISKFMNELYYQIEYKYINVGIKFYLRHNIILELIKIWDIDSQRQITHGGFYIRAYTNVNKATDIDYLDFAEKMLMNLKKDLTNYVELEIPDRKLMDSRINFNNI